MTHSFVHNSFGQKKFSMTLTQNNIRKYQRTSRVGPVLKRGVIASPITRLSSKILVSTPKKCWHIASRTLGLLFNYFNSFRNRTMRKRHLSWSMTLLLQLTNKCEQVFLLMWMHVLIWWMYSEQRKMNFMQR